MRHNFGQQMNQIIRFDETVCHKTWSAMQTEDAFLGHTRPTYSWQCFPSGQCGKQTVDKRLVRRCNRYRQAEQDFAVLDDLVTDSMAETKHLLLSLYSTLELRRHSIDRWLDQVRWGLVGSVVGQIVSPLHLLSLVSRRRSWLWCLWAYSPNCSLLQVDDKCESEPQQSRPAGGKTKEMGWKMLKSSWWKLQRS